MFFADFLPNFCNFLTIVLFYCLKLISKFFVCTHFLFPACVFAHMRHFKIIF